jgi:FkbM family methyltransferase
MHVTVRETTQGLIVDVAFTDDNVVVSLPDHALTAEYMTRVYHEALFRRIHAHIGGFFVGNWIDLGAWIGDNSIPWAKQKAERVVYAIDPSPHNCEYIRLVAHINGLSNVEVLQLAITDQPKLVSTDDDLSHCTLKAGVAGKQTLQAQSLDALWRAGTIANLGYIHLDVEGMEWDVIRGAEEIVRTYRPIFSIEQHLDTDDYRGLAHYLRLRGYRVFMIHEVPPDNRPDCRNFFAFPTERNVDQLVQRAGAPVLLSELQI